jgi:hypothetical protein
MSIIFLFYLALAALAGKAAADGFTAKCSAGWTKVEKNLDPHEESDLSACQTEHLNSIPNNNIKLGGKGSGSVFDIPVDDGGEGCKDSEECMQQCQALCCITKGCRYALIKRDQSKDCEIDCHIYKETKTTWFCRMYSSGQGKGSDDHSYCDSIVDGADVKSATCSEIGCAAFGWTSSQMDSLKQLASVPLDQCPPPTDDENPGKCTGRRRDLLRSTTKQPLIPSPAKIEAAQEAVINRFHAKVLRAVNKAGGRQSIKSKVCKSA